MSDSIISSLIASAIWGLLVVFFSPKIIKFLKKMIVSLMDSGSLFVFNSYNDEEFIKDFKHEMKKAKRLAICTSRGSFLMDPPYREYLNKKTIPIKMICPLSSRQVKYLKVSDKNTYISFWSVGIFMHTISLYIF